MAVRLSRIINKASIIRFQSVCYGGARLSEWNPAKLSTTTSSQTPSELHRTYLEQMEELQAERTSLFGTDSKNSDEDQPPFAPQPFTESEKKQWSDRREAEYGFTQAEQKAWSASGGVHHQHSQSLLDEIERLRHRSSQQDGEVSSTETTSKDPTQPEEQLSHVTSDGKSVHMVNVGSKPMTTRTAVAETFVEFPPEVVQALQNTATDPTTPKGPIFSTATLAGIMAAKQTSQLIPLCHPLPLDQVSIDCTWFTATTVRVECTCRVTHRTGVEMEALTGASIAALTIYDMVKAVSHHVRIKETRLVYKEGGKRRVGH